MQNDVEDYLMKSHINADKSRHRTFLLMYFITFMLNAFIHDNYKEFETVEHTYNAYLHFIINAFKARLLKLKLNFISKLPKDISFKTSFNILHRLEKDLTDRYNWEKIANELESEGMAW